MTLADTTAVRELLTEVLGDYLADNDADDVRVRSYEDAGVMTRDEGLVLRDADGNEFQITIVRSR